jgi:oligopeptide/dipeptide ABC transporter ATP-binding protein
MYRGTIVEFGKARAVLANPQHPYTQLLLDSIPSLRQKWTRRNFAASDLETKEFQFKGCKFYNRCPLAQEVCKAQRPPAVKKDDGREVYCHFV